jgi:hypothetical protein
MVLLDEQMISIRNSRVEWGKAAGDGFTDTITKGASDHVNQFSRNHGTGSESGSANVDYR